MPRSHGFFLSGSGQFMAIDIPGANFTRAAAINGRGDIVGTYRLPTDPMSRRHGFLLSKGGFTTIDPPGAIFTNPPTAAAISWGGSAPRYHARLTVRMSMVFC